MFHLSVVAYLPAKRSGMIISALRAYRPMKHAKDQGGPRAGRFWQFVATFSHAMLLLINKR
jgi:hypothetical protein